MESLKERLQNYKGLCLEPEEFIKQRENIKKDVKEKVLEFEKELNFDLKYLMLDRDIFMDVSGLKRLLKKYKEIFGDWQNE